MLVFNVQSCFGSNMDYAFLFLRTSDGFVFVVLLWSVQTHQHSHTWPRAIYDRKKKFKKGEKNT